MTVLIFLLLLVGFFIILYRPSSKFSLKDLNLQSKRLAITKKRVSKLEKIAIVAKQMLTQSGISQKAFVTATVAVSVVGFLLGYYFFVNTLLSIAMGVAIAPVPYLLVYMRAMKVRSLELDKLESAMSMITNAYAGHFNILAAIENYTREINKGVPAVMRRQTAFDTFVSNSTIVGYSIERSLSILEVQIANSYFSSWVKTLRLCTQNRSMVFALFPIIQSMSDYKNMQTEADTRNGAAWRDYIVTGIIAISLAPALRLINQDWYNILTKTPIGVFLLLLTIIACIVSAMFVIRISSRK